MWMRWGFHWMALAIAVAADLGFIAVVTLAILSPLFQTLSCIHTPLSKERDERRKESSMAGEETTLESEMEREREGKTSVPSTRIKKKKSTRTGVAVGKVKDENNPKQIWIAGQKKTK